jgi:hypothetical protein
MEKPPIRPTTPVQAQALQFPEVQQPKELFEQPRQQIETAPKRSPAREELPVELPEEPKGPSLDELLEQHLAEKRHDLASRAFNAWRYWAAVRSNERKALQKAARRYD